MANRYYTINGRRLPSVTSILSVIDKGVGLQKWIADKGWAESQKILHTSASRGTKFHKIIEQYIKDGVYAEEDYNQEEVRPRCDAFKEFWTGFTKEMDRVPETELTVAEESEGFAGMVDCVVPLGKRKFLLDWKTSKEIRDEYALQTVAYMQAYNFSHPDNPITDRMVVRLPENGPVQVVSYPRSRDLNDYSAFLGALHVFRWKYGQ